MNAVFTIVAKNYLALAKTLIESVQKFEGPSTDNVYFVFIADEFDIGQQFTINGCTILEAKLLNIESFEDLAFKYDITEFCTALKPFCIDYLSKIEEIENIIYFDPDICLFNDLDIVYESLGTNLCLLTPHYMTPQVHYTGVVPEEMILWAGILNLGFIAVNRKNSKYNQFIDWWKNRLYFKCYADKQDGLHTDQKWIDFLPSFFPDDVVISQHMGLNASIWNLHERKVFKKDNSFYVKNLFDEREYTLIFFHFSGFDLNDENIIHKHHPALTVRERPEMAELLNLYRQKLLQNGIHQTINWAYSYNHYENGKAISWFQRRMFRRLKDTGEDLGNPFKVHEGSFYLSLHNNRMLAANNKTDKIKATHIDQHAGKIKFMFCFFIGLKNILGINKYTLLLKFLFRYVRPENQIFLLKEYRSRFQFYNENRIESTSTVKKEVNK